MPRQILRQRRVLEFSSLANHVLRGAHTSASVVVPGLEIRGIRRRVVPPAASWVMCERRREIRDRLAGGNLQLFDGLLAPPL